MIIYLVDVVLNQREFLVSLLLEHGLNDWTKINTRNGDCLSGDLAIAKTCPWCHLSSRLSVCLMRYLLVVLAASTVAQRGFNKKCLDQNVEEP